MSNTTSGGTSGLTLLTILFIGLKLAGIIDWSWWLVLLPFWGGIALGLLMIGIVVAFTPNKP